MKTIIKYKRFFAFSEEKDKCFYTNFDDDVNIVYGKNTSGKSTLLQAINYTFGINDEKHKLSEVLTENVLFRLDIEVHYNSLENITIIRDSEFLFIKRDGEPVKKFFGVSGNNSEEHKLLKNYLAELFGFNLFLETKGEYKLGSIESIFLPYYVAQDYGWVLALKSFRGLDYFKNFKYDYYDYYLGLKNVYDREEKQRLEKEKNIIENEIRFLLKTEKEKDGLQLSKLKDESFISKSADYIENYKEDKKSLIQKEKEYLVLSNKIKFQEERKKILYLVNRNLMNQIPMVNDCPTCHQQLPSSIGKIYEYFQDKGDTDEQLNIIKKDIKDKRGRINSLKNNIEELRKLISEKYAVLENYQIDNLTVGTWLDNKVNVQLSNKILKEIGEVELKLDQIQKKLLGFKTDEQLIQERNNKDSSFIGKFNRYLEELEVEDFNENYSLYRMKLFPQQGVELLKTLLAYYFAFNQVIKKTSYVHRLPFVMDAIFKEDVDAGNRDLILDFIARNKPDDTQIIFSIAESKENQKTVSDYNIEFFNSSAKLIIINTEDERAFLSKYESKYDDIKTETLELII